MMSYCCLSGSRIHKQMSPDVMTPSDLDTTEIEQMRDYHDEEKVLSDKRKSVAKDDKIQLHQEG